MTSNYRYVLHALNYFKNYKLKLASLLVVSGISTAFSLVPVEIFKRLIDVAIPAKDLGMVFNMLLIVFGIHIILLFVDYVQDLVLTKLSLDIGRRLQGDFFENVLLTSEKKRNKLGEGQLMERLIDDTEEVVDSTFDLILSPILELVAIIITLAYMFIISAHLTLVALAFTPLFIVITLFVNRIIRKKYSRIKAAYANVYNVIQKKLARIKEIVAGNKIDHEKNGLVKNIKKYNDLEYDYEKFSIKLDTVTSIISDLAPYSILLYATFLIIEGKFEVGTLLAFSMLMPRLFGPVRDLAGKELEYQTLGVTAKRVFSIFNYKKRTIRHHRKSRK